MHLYFYSLPDNGILLATAEQTVKTVVRPVDQPVAGNKRKIESLKIENLMKKMEKVSAIVWL